MKVVQINAVCGIMSTGRTTQELSIELTNRNIENYVFYSEGTSSYALSQRYISDFQRKVHAIASRVTGLQGYFSKLPTAKLIQRLKRIGPDIVHLRVLHCNNINLNLLFKYFSRNNIAVVITLHDCWFFTGKCTYPIKHNCRQWIAGCKNCPALKDDCKSYFFDFSRKMHKDKMKWLNSIDKLAVVGVSDWVTAESSKSFLSKREPIRIYNWIDRSVFYPRNTKVNILKKGNLNAKHIILGVSTFWSDTKGFQDFLSIAQRLNDNYCIVLVGEMNPTSILPSNIIHITSTTNADELAGYYSNASVFVNPSRFETFGKTTAEAICCGTPVVVYRNTASPELVGSGCGYTVETGDIDELLQCIYRVCENGKEMYTNSCIEFGEKQFSKEQNVNQYIELYYKLTNNR